MKIAIVEDDIQQQNCFISLVNRYTAENSLPVSITSFNDGIDIVEKYKGDFDVIYFDVEMPIMDGMTSAKKIRAMDPNVIIVFLTNYVQFAIDGYAVNADDFLLKPLTYFNFSEHFKKIVKKLSNTTDQTITIKTNSGIRKILLEDLIYVECEGHYLYFYTNDQVYSFLGSMKNIESELKPKHFFRCNNCYLVNLKHVKAVDGSTVHVGRFDLRISRPRKKDFMAALTNYLGSGGV
ncbi:LytR/AlgR family response regulator transcription factor [Candidatus Enterococcus ferrettii]|uniref:Stage 0 sporulation protein A homolog n=1 Tax=Candidatus Enterococcus ferrettii TaxID=2815324 RepID=A0ABV0EMQ0_9ENTE|nr:LytTR family DNA-binding domain-containing protein [Enterococcus sp. 665A]MBO1339654.1 response regulator transcription factor [Enterococcus sp. 665A]